jgi:hypothetical protein
MSFDPTFLFFDFIIGGVGLVLFIYGKKQQRLPQLVAGLLLMVYPYFVSTVAAILGVAAVIGVGLWWVIRVGY